MISEIIQKISRSTNITEAKKQDEKAGFIWGWILANICIVENLVVVVIIIIIPQ